MLVGADGAVVGADHCGGADDGDGIVVVGLENLNSVLVEADGYWHHIWTHWNWHWHWYPVGRSGFSLQLGV